MTKLRRRHPIETDALPGIGLARRLVFAQLIFAPLLFWPDVHDPFELVKVTALMATAILLAALVYPILCSIDPRRWADAGVLLFVFSAAVSTATSLSWRTSVWGIEDSRCGLIAIFAL